MPDWPHAPVHRLESKGAYMVTGGTYLKIHLLNEPERLSLVRDTLFRLAHDYGWALQAWAILSNHYHLLGMSPPDPTTLRVLISVFHAETAAALNRMDGTPGRRVWYQYWDTLITFPNSYYARLHYIHQNPVHHGVVLEATLYPWCSAAWFQRMAKRPFRKMVESFKTDRIHIFDDY